MAQGQRRACDWYEQLVGAARIVKVSPSVPAPTMAGLAAWLYRQVSAGLSLYAEYMGGDVGALEELLEERN